MLRHTDREYEHELETLRERILYMGAEAERLVEVAFTALQQRDVSRAHAAIEMDEAIDRLEVEIDELCLRILARRQPVASDLRFVTTALKLVTDLERAADLGVNIAERVTEIVRFEPYVDLSETLERMASVTRGMLRDALDAFVAGDVPKAEQVMDRDEAVDALYGELFPALIGQMVARIDCIEQATRIQSIGKYIERIGDHATNIAEMVVFMVRGQDIRHHAEARAALSK